MKNGANSGLIKRLRAEDLRAYGILALFGVLSALFIQREFRADSILGAILLSTTLLFVFYRDILRYKPSLGKDYQMLILLGVLVSGTILIDRLFGFALEALARGWGRETNSYLFGIPFASGGMLVALLFDFHIAIFFSFIMGILGGLWLGNPIFSLYIFLGSLVGAFGVFRCKKRTAIVKSGLYVLGANLLVVISAYLIEGVELPISVGFSVFSSMAVVAIVSMLLPVLEYIFNVTTNISLLELLDLDQPLMKTLMIQAPGTYHHSIIVGNLVDSVAEKVGVNPLLARVAAYYHDIGKIKMPEYFIENSPQAPLKHEKLTPHMSSMILISHVKEGVELARQYKLPKPIIDIIQQHHGSSLITYFYQKAKTGEEEPSEEAYKYLGPKPQSRVAALVMMADAVEAASRVLIEPTPARIKGLVDKIIDHMYLEGQLDECELTLKDITEIKKHFTHILTGVMHKRIDYPGFEFEEKKENGLGQKPAEKGKDRPPMDREDITEGSTYTRA